ncbi:GNAT family N-acetyltransferase [Psychrobacter sp.]|uniref:GNAT family N-acetyltransferase n=1 Tax=Psychrobacter sp. TaxID=56811 RepID=UPI002647C57B|nr:GNAT family N-acetyltransferase [Psychrobacter sp.]MDN6276513.1 N-acetyltransferase [Psychrobacter sp.]MDN6307697.1 N-acetyltransferase [Psychrobacter sp.]
MNTQTFEEPINITHNESANRFETTIDSHTGYISYQDRGNELVYDHTVVPQQLGGRGLGSALVKHALDFARQQEKKVVPQCSFVSSYISKNPEYKDLL